jgi:methyltransferase family protein
VLLIDCGTGADFEFLPRDVRVTAVDLTPAMLRRAASKVEGRHIRLLEMDAWTSGFQTTPTTRRSFISSWRWCPTRCEPSRKRSE